MRIARRWFGAIGHRLGRIAHVFIEGLRIFRGFETKRISGMEIQSALNGLARRPGLESAPAMCSGFKNVGFSRSIVGITLQVMAEEWQFYLFAVVLGCFGAEADRTKLLAGSPAPVSVRPWSHYQGVRDSWVHPLR